MRGRQGETANEIKRDSGEWKEEAGDKRSEERRVGKDKRMAIFSFGCLNWHEEPNQISLAQAVTWRLRRRRDSCMCFRVQKRMVYALGWICCMHPSLGY